MGRRFLATKGVQREPQCDLVVVRPTHCFLAQRRWELGKDATASTTRVPSSPGRTRSRFLNDWVYFTRSKFVLSPMAISSAIVLTQHVPNWKSPGSVQVKSTHTTIHKLTSDMSNSTMGIGLNEWSVKRFLCTLLTEYEDNLFAEEAVRQSVEQVLTFFSNDSPRDDLRVRMTLLLERSQNQSRR